MLVKNLTPFFHGTKVTSRRPPQPEMTLVVRGTFRLVQGGVVEVIESLEQGFLSGDVFADDDVERAGELVHASDFADFKLNAEVLFRGSCHTPGGKARAECPVRLGLGSWKKDLVVRGDRRWKRGITGSKPGEAKPFRSMPIDYRHAFGGPGFARNPVGKGYDDDALPNVESPAAEVRARGDQPAPVGFGPLNPGWPERARKTGSNWGKGYLSERAPFYADDFDWSHFSAAPADQQLEGYLRGDEELTLVNLHPDHALLQTRLPGLRVRAFLKDEHESFREIGMVLDTVSVDGDEGVVRLCWRGVEPVASDDLDDVRTVLVASEALASERLPLDHYRAELDAFEKDPTGVLGSLPAGLRELWERYQREKRGEVIPDEPAEGLDPLTALAKSRFGALISDEHLADIRGAAEKLEAALGSADLPEAAKKEAARVKLQEAADRARAEAAAEAPLMRFRKPGRMHDPGLREKMRLVVDNVHKLRAAEKETGRSIDGIDKLEALPHDPRLKELDPDYQPPGPLSDDAPGPGANLSERDFSGQDLSGLDLRGANLARANLSRANLKGTNLSGANLTRAIVWLADLEGADLSEADLSLVNGAYLKGRGARFERANFAEAFLEGAVLVEAKLAQARFDYAVLEEADLSRASAEQACFDHADLSRAKLEKARFVGASFELALCGECAAARSDFSGAKLVQTNFVAADLRAARLVDVLGPKAFFMDARLDDAELGFADLSQAHFTKASAARARFYGANLREARFYRTDLSGAQLVRCNLMSADLRKARLDKTSFIGASLYDAKLLDVRGSGWDLTEANIKRMQLVAARGER
jgi:uncharacterized protein YjbI with pentapeptide repeats